MITEYERMVAAINEKIASIVEKYEAACYIDTYDKYDFTILNLEEMLKKEYKN